MAVDARIDMGSGRLIGAGEAARRLGVKRATLYTYVSRGWLRRWPGDDGESRYLASDVEDLARRAAAHKGHGAAAGEALRWGPPVLSSAITSIDVDGPNYRGAPALTLAERHVSWERVAELLWTGALPAAEPDWPAPWEAPPLPPGPPLVRGPALLAWLSLQHPLDLSRPGAELEAARRLARTLAGALGRPADTVAACLAGARPELAGRIDQALVLCADHELNASAFAGRVAAAAGADLYGAALAAMATFSGARHGGASGEVLGLLRACQRAPAAEVLRQHGQAQRPIPGVGHPLYPEGDPRGAMLLALAAEAPGGGAEPALALAAALEAAGAPAPNLDFGLAAFVTAWGLPEALAPTLFLVGRFAGWIAHALEQRQSPGLLRPRAHYTGP